MYQDAYGIVCVYVKERVRERGGKGEGVGEGEKKSWKREKANESVCV